RAAPPPARLQRAVPEGRRADSRRARPRRGRTRDSPDPLRRTPRRRPGAAGLRGSARSGSVRPAAARVHDPGPRSGSYVRSAENADDGVESAVEDVCLDHEGRRENEDVAVAAAAADENTPLPQLPLDPAGVLGIRLPRIPAGHDLEPDEEAAA